MRAGSRSSVLLLVGVLGAIARAPSTRAEDAPTTTAPFSRPGAPPAAPPPAPAPVPAPAPPAAPPLPAPPAPAAPPPAVPADGPRATFDRDAHDFGACAQEQELHAEFRLTNTGTAPLHVKAVRADCGCAGAAVDGVELAVGQSTTIRATLRTLTMSGTLHKRILVDSDDPTRPTAELRLTVAVAEGVVLAPARFYFGDVAAGTAPSTTMRIQWHETFGRAFALTGLEAPGMDVALTSKRFDAAPWHGFEVTATFAKPPPIGTVSGSVILRTDDEAHPRLVVPVQAFVSGKVWVDRRAVTLGIVPAGKGRETAVIARPFSPDLDLGTVTARARKGRVAATAVRSGREWVVTIKLPASAAPGPIEDVVEVASQLPGEPPAEVAVRGTVTEPPK